jgi:hypothetical protein
LTPSFSIVPDDKKTLNEDAVATSAASSGTKRAYDGKDGPDGKCSRMDNQKQQKPGEKPRGRDRETSNEHDTASTPPHPRKRARKASKGIKSGKTLQLNPANDSPVQAESLSPRSKPISTSTLPNQSTSAEPDTATPSVWKHGAQSPRKNSNQRASVTLSPRRNSNAGALEPTSPARQTENLAADKLVAIDTPSSAPTPTPHHDDFTFSPCDADKEGVISVVSGPASIETDGQTASVSPLQEASLPATDHGSHPRGQQAARGQPGLGADITALMDELDAALEMPIGM